MRPCKAFRPYSGRNEFNFMPILISGILAFFGLSLAIFPDFFASLINLLPEGGTLPEPVHIGAIYFGHALASVDFLLPVRTLVMILQISYSILCTLLVLHLGWKIMTFFRGTNSNKFI